MAILWCLSLTVSLGIFNHNCGVRGDGEIRFLESSRHGADAPMAAQIQEDASGANATTTPSDSKIELHILLRHRIQHVLINITASLVFDLQRMHFYAEVTSPQ
jgi:hypothetical protein